MKRKLAVLLTAATVFSAVLPTTCMAAENKADIPEENNYHILARNGRCQRRSTGLSGK